MLTLSIFPTIVAFLRANLTTTLSALFGCGIYGIS